MIRLLFVLCLAVLSGAAAPLPAGNLLASGSQITDGSGNNVRLSCVEHGETGPPTADFVSIASAGFNCVRFGWYDTTLSLANLDTVATAATQNGLKVIFEHRGNEHAASCLLQQKNGLWYDKNGTAPNTTTNGTDGCGTTGTITYAQFKTNWVSIATHFSGNTTVVGFDLHNAPVVQGVGLTSPVNWGSGDGSDMRAMCNDVGAAVNAADTGALVICEGPINSGTLFSASGGGGAGTLKVVQARVQTPAITTTDTSNIVWRLSPMGQVMYGAGTPSTVDTSTGQVTKLVVIGSTIHHQNFTGNWFSKAVTASPVNGGWVAESSPLSATQAERTQDIVNIFGMNAHMQVPDNSTTNYVTALEYTGARLFRTPWDDGNTLTEATLNAVYAAIPGVKGLFLPGNNVGTDLNLFATTLNNHITKWGVNSIFSFEGPNEPQGGCCGPWSQAQVNQGAINLANAINGRSDAKNIVPSITYSDLFQGSGANVLNYNNGVFPPGGDETGAGVNWLNHHGYVGVTTGGLQNCVQAWNIPALSATDNNGPAPGHLTDQMRAASAGGRPYAMTEFGCTTPGLGGGIDATGLAGQKMSLNYWLDSYFAGAGAAIYYEIFNESGDTFETFQVNSPTSITPYPIATAFHNATAILCDGTVAGSGVCTPTATATTFATHAPNLSVTGIPTSGTFQGRFIISEKTSGKYEVIAWNEPPVQDGNHPPNDITPTATTVTVTGPMTKAVRYDPTVGTAVQQTFCAGPPCSGSFTFNLFGGPQIIEITP